MRNSLFGLSLTLVVFALLGCSNDDPAKPPGTDPPDPGATVVSTWGGTGTGEGEFDFPRDIAVDDSGNVYVVDSRNFRIQKFSSDGVFLDAWGQFGCRGDLEGHMATPRRLAFNHEENLLLTDRASGCGVLWVNVFSTKGVQLERVRMACCNPGEIIEGLAVDPSGAVTLVIFDQVHRYTKDFEFIERLGGEGSAPGEFIRPLDVAMAGDGSVYVTDTQLKRVTKLDAQGQFVHMWGTMGSEEGEFTYPSGLAIDKQGRVYVADAGDNDRVQVFDSDGQFVLALGPTLSTGGQLKGPVGVAIGPKGDIFVADTGNNRVVRLKALDF